MTALPRPVHAHRPSLRRALGRAGLAVIALAAALPAQALYKIVGPDGRVTYSDRPPADAQAATRTVTPGGPAAPAVPLPASLREVVARYPVTLYSGEACAACDQARALLRERGVPHAERLVTSPAEAELLSRTTGGNELPTIAIGTQVLRGYAADEWGDYLDVAGYPRQSLLPASYRPAAASRLIPEPRVVQPAASGDDAAATRSAPTPLSDPSPSNPAGIRF